MRRVVVTGLGITSSIGNNAEEVADSLKAGRSGIVFAEEYARLGFRSQVHGTVKIDLDAAIDRRQRRFMGDGAAYAYLYMQHAIACSRHEERQLVNDRTGLLVGSGDPSTRNLTQAADIPREKGVKKIGPFMVPRCMSS